MREKKPKFHGVDRDKIDWHPMMNEEKCSGCGLCVTTCGRGVYKFDYDSKKAKIVNPNSCMVACQTCSNLCPTKAIFFAKGDKTREKVQKILKKNDVFKKVNEELANREDELRMG